MEAAPGVVTQWEVATVVVREEALPAMMVREEWVEEEEVEVVVEKGWGKAQEDYLNRIKSRLRRFGGKEWLKS